MVTLYLDRIFNPQTVAIVGVSDEEGTVGYALIKNFTELGFTGKVYPVNIRKTEILGLKAYQTVDQIPEPVDLAVIATPAKTVSDVVEQCGKAGIKGIIIISAGFKETGAEETEPKRETPAPIEKKEVQVKKKEAETTSVSQ